MGTTRSRPALVADTDDHSLSVDILDTQVNTLVEAHTSREQQVKDDALFKEFYLIEDIIDHVIRHRFGDGLFTIQLNGSMQGPFPF